MSKSKKVVPAVKRSLPDTRTAITHKFSVDGSKFYINVGLYADGKPGELFIINTDGDPAIRGLLDSFAMSVSMGLQHGIPIEVMVKQFTHRCFSPRGITTNPQIPIAKSIVD
jgi:ribonucleoside-diphosphate reductase alpha chain